MSTAKTKIENAYKWAVANRPQVDGFPYLAECLRQAGVLRYVYHFPSCQCIFFTGEGQVASQGEVLLSGMSDVPSFDQEAFLRVLKASQKGEITFPEFLKGTWKTGVINYEADLIARKVSYYGANGESYIEDYPAVKVEMK